MDLNIFNEDNELGHSGGEKTVIGARLAIVPVFF